MVPSVVLISVKNDPTDTIEAGNVDGLNWISAVMSSHPEEVLFIVRALVTVSTVSPAAFAASSVALRSMREATAVPLSASSRNG